MSVRDVSAMKIKTLESRDQLCLVPVRNITLVLLVFLQPHEEDSQLADLSAQYTAFKAQWFAALCSPSLFAMASHEEVAKPKCEVGQVVVPRSFTMSLFE
jgi:hypothetical protein